MEDFLDFFGSESFELVDFAGLEYVYEVVFGLDVEGFVELAQGFWSQSGYVHEGDQGFGDLFTQFFVFFDGASFEEFADFFNGFLADSVDFLEVVFFYVGGDVFGEVFNNLCGFTVGKCAESVGVSTQKFIHIGDACKKFGEFAVARSGHGLGRFVGCAVGCWSSCSRTFRRNWSVSVLSG